MKSKNLLLVLLLSTFLSCLQEENFETGTDSARLVVEGFINDLDGGHIVKLTTLAELNGEGVNSLGRGADVQIQEIDGPRISYTETTPGTYQIEPGILTGEVGKSYQLLIQLSNGEEYISTIQTMQPPIGIADGDAEFVREFIENEDGTVRQDLSHNITVEIENQSNEHFFIVENRGWAEVEIGYDDCGFFDPPEAGPSTCWSIRDPIVTNQVVIGNNIGLSNENYEIPTLSVPFDAKGQFVALIRVNSMSAANYAFWERVNNQLNRSGGIFDRPIAPIIGNVVNTRTNESALGYFHAYSTSEQVICFDRSRISATLQIPGPIPCNLLCTDVWGPATFDNISLIFCR